MGTLRELGYEVNKPIGEMMNDLNEDPKFLYADTPDRKEIVIRDYNKMVKEAEEDVRPYFERFPVSPVEVRAVPPARTEAVAPCIPARVVKSASRGCLAST